MVKFPSIFVSAQLCQNFGRETNKTKQAGIGPTNQRMTCHLLGKIAIELEEKWKVKIQNAGKDIQNERRDKVITWDTHPLGGKWKFTGIPY